MIPQVLSMLRNRFSTWQFSPSVLFRKQSSVMVTKRVRSNLFHLEIWFAVCTEKYLSANVNVIMTVKRRTATTANRIRNVTKGAARPLFWQLWLILSFWGGRQELNRASQTFFAAPACITSEPVNVFFLNEKEGYCMLTFLVQPWYASKDNNRIAMSGKVHSTGVWGWHCVNAWQHRRKFFLPWSSVLGR